MLDSNKEMIRGQRADQQPGRYRWRLGEATQNQEACLVPYADKVGSCHRFIYVRPEFLFRPPFGVGILLPTFDPEVPDLVTAGALAGSRFGALCSTCVLRRFIVQPAGPIR